MLAPAGTNSCSLLFSEPTNLLHLRGLCLWTCVPRVLVHIRSSSSSHSIFVTLVAAYSSRNRLKNGQSYVLLQTALQFAMLLFASRRLKLPRLFGSVHTMEMADVPQLPFCTATETEIGGNLFEYISKGRSQKALGPMCGPKVEPRTSLFDWHSSCQDPFAVLLRVDRRTGFRP